MEEINYAGILLAAAGILTPIFTFALGLLQARQKRERDKADTVISIATSAKNLGEAWEKVADDLREDIKRIREEAEEREQVLLEDQRALHIKMEQYQTHTQAVLNNEMEHSKKLEIRLNQVEAERDEIKLENDALKKLVNSLTEKLSIAQEQIEAFRIELKKVNRDVKAVKKKQTGELKFPEGEEKEEEKEKEDS